MTLYIRKDKGQGKFEYVEAPLKEVSEDVQVMPHPVSDGIILVLGGTRVGIPLAQAEGMDAAITAAIDEVKGRTNAERVPQS